MSAQSIRNRSISFRRSRLAATSTDEPKTTEKDPLSSSIPSSSFYQLDSPGHGRHATNDPILVRFPTLHFTSQSYRYSPFNFMTTDRLSPTSSRNSSVNGFFTDILPKDRVSVPQGQAPIEHVCQAPLVFDPSEHERGRRTPISPPLPNSPRDQTCNTNEFPVYKPTSPRTPPSVVTADQAPKFRKLEFSMAAGLQWHDVSSE